MFQLTDLSVRGPATSSENFSIKLHRVGIAEDEVREALLRVRDVVRSPQFTQQNCFSDSVVSLLTECAPICDSITRSAV